MDRDADAAGMDRREAAGYHVHLDVFTGPFDLLLQLIARRRLDITQVDLADITQDFLSSLKGLDELDLETSTRFLVVAATLVELKASRLLPQSHRDELDDLLGDARDLLYARLLEYRAFRDVAVALRERLEYHDGQYGRAVALDAVWRQVVPDAPLHIDAEALARLAAVATTAPPEPTVRLDHIRRSFLTIQDAATQVLDTVLVPGDTAAFASLVTGRHRGDAIVFFLAVLELYKLGHLDLDQPHHRGEVTMARRDSTADLGVLSEATSAEGGP